MGNSRRVAQQHYLQVTDDDFERALQQPAADGGNELQPESQESLNAAPCDVVPINAIGKIAEAGLEPARVSGNDTNGLSQLLKSGDAKSGAFSTDILDCDSELNEILSAWPHLSESLKASILDMARQARQQC